MMNRRDLLKSGVISLFFPVSTLGRSVPQVYDCYYELVFKNGDVQKIFMKYLENEKVSCLYNEMGHEEIKLQTTYNFEKFFHLGGLCPFEDIKAETIYRGFDKNGVLVYTGDVIEKKWIKL